MTTLIADLRVVMTLFTAPVYTVAAILLVIIVFLGIVGPFYELVRYERRWFDQ